MTSRRHDLSESRMLTKGSKEYEDLRERIWNRDVPRRFPERIMRARSEDDVVDAVRLARDRGWRVALRSGGHNWFGTSLREGGLLLDLGEMRELVSVDAEHREAVVEPALTGRDLVQRLEPYGLTFPIGHCASVPMGGYLLSGGFGWNVLAWGPACFSIRSLDVVTAEGKLITASPDQNSEWYWAARGGSHGFFGAVVRYRIGLFPRPRAITTSTCLFPLDRVSEVSTWASALRSRLPNHVELTVILGRIPEGLTGGEKSPSHAVIVTATAFSDSEEEAHSALAPVADPPAGVGCLRQLLDEATPYEALAGLGAELWPEGHRYRSDNFWYNDPLSTVLPRMGGLAAESPERSFFLCLPVPPPDPTSTPPPDAAFSMIGATFAACYTVWNDPKNDEAADEWYKRSVRALEPGSIGHYVGETDIESHPDRAMRSFSRAAWQRLQGLRKKHDPSGRFYGFYAQT